MISKFLDTGVAGLSLFPLFESTNKYKKSQSLFLMSTVILAKPIIKYFKEKASFSTQI